jgi:hypothetical protein
MDGGINGGMTGSDVACTISMLDVHKHKVTRIGETTLNHLPLVTTAGFVDTHHGPAIIFLHQYAHYEKANTIHSAGQLRPFSTQVHKMPRHQRS